MLINNIHLNTINRILFNEIRFMQIHCDPSIRFSTDTLEFVSTLN